MNAEAPRWHQYIPTVQAFLPGCEGDELRDRCGLLLMRDQAMVTKQNCSEEAYALLDHVERTASAYAFQSMRLDFLHRLRAALLKVVTASSDLEAFARDFLNPQPAPGEGENARD